MATSILKVYSQKAAQERLESGFSVAVPGQVEPNTRGITVPHRIQKLEENGKISGYIIHRDFSK
ncbi:MAG TPA: hypothetical protein VFQ59_00635 [Candidatus Paceibacterota bacterium]|nr:hypothetical protein [Candidatus Paceibacterota bacterium]